MTLALPCWSVLAPNGVLQSPLHSRRQRVCSQYWAFPFSFSRTKAEL